MIVSVGCRREEGERPRAKGRAKERSRKGVRRPQRSAASTVDWRVETLDALDATGESDQTTR